jgi:hypothetical protein
MCPACVAEDKAPRNQRARFLFEGLKPEPHPEGGYYRGTLREGTGGLTTVVLGRHGPAAERLRADFARPGIAADWLVVFTRGL